MKKLYTFVIVLGVLAGFLAHPQNVRADGYENKIFLPVILNGEDNVEPPQPVTCGYREGMGESPDEGILIDPGTLVQGPAILLPQFEVEASLTNTPNDGVRYILAVYPDVEYVAFMQMKAWLYEGNDDCLEAQFEYFSDYNIIEIH